MTVAQQQEIFDAALELTDAAERGALLDRACAGSPQIRAQLEDLLAVQAGAEKFFSDSTAAIVLTAEEQGC